MRNLSRLSKLLSTAALSSLLFACAAPGRPSQMPAMAAPSDSRESSPSMASAGADSASMSSSPMAPPTAPAVGQAFAGNVATTAPASTPAVAKTTADTKSAQPQQEVSSPDVFILYTGGLNLLVDDGKIAPTIDKVIDAAIAVGGHIGSRKDTSVSVIVPSKSFRAVFAER